jgi:hypothetical protein
MTLERLLFETKKEISLLQDLIMEFSKDIEAYPASKYSIQSMVSVQHCYNTLKRLNDILADSSCSK